MYKDAFELIQKLVITGKISWFKFLKDGSIHIKFNVEPKKIVFNSNMSVIEILEIIECYENQ
jgi:hypothetical protein